MAGKRIPTADLKRAAYTRARGGTWEEAGDAVGRKPQTIIGWTKREDFRRYLSEAAAKIESSTSAACAASVSIAEYLEIEALASYRKAANIRDDAEASHRDQLAAIKILTDGWSKIQDQLAEARKSQAEAEQGRETLEQFIRRVGLAAIENECRAIREDDEGGQTEHNG